MQAGAPDRSAFAGGNVSQRTRRVDSVLLPSSAYRTLPGWWALIIGAD